MSKLSKLRKNEKFTGHFIFFYIFFYKKAVDFFLPSNVIYLIVLILVLVLHTTYT